MKKVIPPEMEEAISHDHMRQINKWKGSCKLRERETKEHEHQSASGTSTQSRYLSGTLQVLCCGEVKVGAVEGLLFT